MLTRLDAGRHARPEKTTSMTVAGCTIRADSEKFHPAARIHTAQKGRSRIHAVLPTTGLAAARPPMHSAPAHPLGRGEQSFRFLKRHSHICSSFPAAFSRRTAVWKDSGRRCRQQCHDGLARVFRPFGQLNGGPDSRARGDAHQHALQTAHQTACGKGVLILHGYDLVINMSVQNFGHKTCADALDLVRPGCAIAQHRRGRRLHGYYADGRVLRLEISATR